jgi:site-specific recombinase XerD
MERIARLVGHTKITTTDGYLHVQMKALQEAVSVLNDKEAAA